MLESGVSTSMESRMLSDTREIYKFSENHMIHITPNSPVITRFYNPQSRLETQSRFQRREWPAEKVDVRYSSRWIGD